MIIAQTEILMPKSGHFIALRERIHHGPSDGETIMPPTNPITLYGFKLSGHSHRAELMLRLLDLPYRFEAVDLANGAQNGAAFGALNCLRTVPVIDDGGTVIADSVAILVYLATRYDPARRWLPADPVGQAQVQRWLSVAQNQIAHGPAMARVIQRFKRPYDLKQAQAIAGRLFPVLDAELGDRDYLVGAQPSIADVALYSYTAVAPEGGIDLAPFPAINAWLKRIEALPGFEGMPR
jgi:glutathione S-transferase